MIVVREMGDKKVGVIEIFEKWRGGRKGER